MEALRRICLIGPECTGKTTAAKTLAAHYGTVWVPEAAREHALAVGRPLTVDDHGLIAHRHLVNESRLAPDARGVLILDCDLVSTVVYARHYYGVCAPWVLDHARARLADDYLLFDVDLPWAYDTVRDPGHDRELLRNEFAATLRELGGAVSVIRGKERATPWAFAPAGKDRRL